MTSPTPTSAINIKLAPTLLDQITQLAQAEGRPTANYIRHTMQQYLTELDYSQLPETPPKAIRTTGWGKEKQDISFVIRLPTLLKEEFYRVAELQGHKGAALIKRILRHKVQDHNLQES